MRWNPYLAFDGRCREAFEFYEKCLGGKVVAMISYGDTPAKEHMPANTGARIMHARLVLGDQVLMGCDAHPAMPYDGIRGCDVAVHVKTPDEADKREAKVVEMIRWFEDDASRSEKGLRGFIDDMMLRQEKEDEEERERQKQNAEREEPQKLAAEHEKDDGKGGEEDQVSN